jgi:hypothetical protein
LADKFAGGYADNLIAGSRDPYAVTPHDTNELGSIPKALYIGTGGNVVLRGIESTADVTFKNLPSGYTLCVRAKLVKSTGTTASDIVALA